MALKGRSPGHKSSFLRHEVGEETAGFCLLSSFMWFLRVGPFDTVITVFLCGHNRRPSLGLEPNAGAEGRRARCVRGSRAVGRLLSARGVKAHVAI